MEEGVGVKEAGEWQCSGVPCQGRDRGGGVRSHGKGKRGAEAGGCARDGRPRPRDAVPVPVEVQDRTVVRSANSKVLTSWFQLVIEFVFELPLK